MPWHIYGLRKNEVGSAYRYIGLTTKPLKERLRFHCNDSKRKTTPVCTWIASERFDILIEPIEVCPEDDMTFLLEREVYWIAHYRTLQGDLKGKQTPDYIKNANDGGAGTTYGTKLTAEHVENIRAGVRKHFDDNGHKGVYDFWLEKYGKDEADSKLVGLKKKRSEQMSGAGNNMYGKTGPDAPCYGRLGDKHPMFGTHHSEESKRKISAATKGRPKSAATKVRMSFANHIRSHSEKIKDTCRWCLGADLQTEIDKETKLHDQANDMERRLCADSGAGQRSARRPENSG